MASRGRFLRTVDWIVECKYRAFCDLAPRLVNFPRESQAANFQYPSWCDEDSVRTR
jgi:hypothetical protein